MSEISRLESQIEETEEQIQACRKDLEENPDSLTYDLTLSSLEKQRNQLREELREAKMAREKEVIEYRLKGKLAQDGAIPLGIIGDLAKHLERQIYAAAYFIKDGKDLRARVPNELRQEVNLQLVGLKPGSTRLTVSGDVSPNVFGDSVIEKSLEGTFRLLEAETSEEVSECASEVGPRSAEKLHSFLDTIQKNDLTIDIKWSTPSHEVKCWEGDEPNLEAITDNLQQIQEEDTREEIVEGKVRMLNTLGRFKLETDDGEVYDCKYPTSLQEDMTNLHLEEQVKAKLWRHVIKNSATGHEKVSYRLQSISNLD